jgi:hypothetical protein
MLPDAFNAAHSANCAGCEHQNRGDFTSALNCYRRALALFEQACDVHGRVFALVNVAEIHCQMNDAVQATAALDQAQALLDITPDTDQCLAGVVLGHRGLAAAVAGDLDAAEGLLLRGLQVVRHHGGAASQERDMLKLLAIVLERRGDHAAVAELVRQIGVD